MIHVNIKLSIRQCRRLWDACQAAEAACEKGYLAGGNSDIIKLILEDARHDYADLQSRIDEALLAYNPIQRAGSEAVGKGAGEGGGGL